MRGPIRRMRASAPDCNISAVGVSDKICPNQVIECAWDVVMKNRIGRKRRGFNRFGWSRRGGIGAFSWPKLEDKNGGPIGGPTENTGCIGMK